MFQVLNTMEPTTTTMQWQFQTERKVTTIKAFIDTFDYGTVAFVETKKSAGNVSEVLKEMKDFNFFQDSNYRKRSKKSKIKNELFPEHAKLKLVSNMFICQTENCLADIHVGEERFVFSEQKKIKACPIVKNRMHDSECSSFTSDPLISREDEQMSSYEPAMTPLTNLPEPEEEETLNHEENVVVEESDPKKTKRVTFNENVQVKTFTIEYPIPIPFGPSAAKYRMPANSCDICFKQFASELDLRIHNGWDTQTI